MVNARNAACAFYLSGTVFFTAGIKMGQYDPEKPIGPLQRGQARGEVDGLPRLAPDDPMANAAILTTLLNDVPVAGGEGARGETCRAAARSFPVQIEGRLTWVRFASRAVCQLELLKRVSIAQPGFGAHGLGEVGAFVVGVREKGGTGARVTRIVVPPFSYTRDTLSFMPADLGELREGERLIGTYHTHPEGDLEQGALSQVDLRYFRTGYIDFHGKVGYLASRDEQVDWLFDIVDPRDGNWNVYAHDTRRLEGLLEVCESGVHCPLNELRVAGSRFYLLTRHYEENVSGFWEPGN